MVSFDYSLIFGIALVIVTITLFFRFNFKMKSPTVMRGFKRKLGLPFLIRVHHLFSGLILAGIAYFYDWNFVFNVGFGIALSDIFHHIALKVFTGNAEFHFTEKDIVLK